MTRHEHDTWPGPKKGIGIDGDVSVHLIREHGWSEAEVILSAKNMGAHQAHYYAHMLREAVETAEAGGN